MGAAVFFTTSATWFLPAVFLGSEGFADYFGAIHRQWSSAVKVYDIAHLESPWLLNLLYRGERFLVGYYVVYPWTGGDSKTAASLLLIAPWLFGFALFLTSFRFRDPFHLLLAIWLLSIAYPVLTIHFLPRYGLPNLPGFIISSILGYQYLISHLRFHPRRFEVLSLAGFGAILLLYAIKYQPPVNSFESSPPGVEPYIGVMLLLAGLALFLSWHRARFNLPRDGEGSDTKSGASERRAPSIYLWVLSIFLALLIVPYALTGYRLASLAHNTPQPEREVGYLRVGIFQGGSSHAMLG